MTKTNKAYFGITAILLLLFVVFTILLRTVDVAVPRFDAQSPTVGFETVNSATFEALGQSDSWYAISDMMGIFMILAVLLFAAVGAVQLFKRKSLMRVDAHILLLGVFYVLVALCYVLFEIVVINHRPIMVDGAWAASYPSSHTVLVCCVMGSSVPALFSWIKRKPWRIAYGVFAFAVMVLTVIGRLLSGVHWLTDILGGVLLSAALVMLYISFLTLVKDRGAR